MRCSCGRVVGPHGVFMLDVIVFMPNVDSLNQMINPFNLSLDPGPESWPLVSLPPQKLGPHITRLTGSLKLCDVY